MSLSMQLILSAQVARQLLKTVSYMLRFALSNFSLPSPIYYCTTNVKTNFPHTSRRKFDHPNIVKILGICVDNDPVFIIMELMPAGDLLQFLREARPELVSIFLYTLHVRREISLCYY